MLNKRALLKLGWTPALIGSVLGAPDEKKQHVHGYKRWIEHLYSETRVHEAIKDERFQKRARERKQRALNAQKRRDAIPVTYATWRDALPAACEGLFSLNRYAKHRTCSESHRTEIYRLKDELIQTLYQHGYCELSWLHRQNAAEQVCRECGGDGGDCQHCYGTGIWKEARTLEFWCFHFAVGLKRYCWHQPKSLVNFAPVENIPPQDWAGIVKEKPVPLHKNRFALAKELIQWVIDASSGELDIELTGGVPSPDLFALSEADRISL
jgi:hypothetical protein